ncbi:Pleckstrin [Trichinella spiralis]|uniref:Pleckstrin n=1 Tax=Trichinella spiralis TaxID=6334 RepID=A0ABR3KMQ2_TRISP
MICFKECIQQTLASPGRRIGLLFSGCQLRVGCPSKSAEQENMHQPLHSTASFPLQLNNCYTFCLVIMSEEEEVVSRGKNSLCLALSCELADRCRLRLASV